MKTTRRLQTREELLDSEGKYFPGTLGNILSLGAAHFRQTNRSHRSAHPSASRTAVKPSPADFPIR